MDKMHAALDRLEARSRTRSCADRRPLRAARAARDLPAESRCRQGRRTVRRRGGGPRPVVSLAGETAADSAPGCAALPRRRCHRRLGRQLLQPSGGESRGSIGRDQIPVPEEAVVPTSTKVDGARGSGPHLVAVDHCLVIATFFGFTACSFSACTSSTPLAKTAFTCSVSTSLGRTKRRSNSRSSRSWRANSFVFSSLRLLAASP